MKKFPIYYEWVQTLMDYNDELMGIINEIHLNSDTKANHNSMKLIDFDVNNFETDQQTASASSSSPIIDNEDISKQNVRLDKKKTLFILTIPVYV